MVRLPVSSAVVLFRLPDGSDELALHEATEARLPAALGMLERLAVRPDGGAADLAGLTVTDFEVLLLRLRQRLLGSLISSDVACPACHERAEISFGLDDYLAAVRPVRPAGVTLGPRDGWLALEGEAFRLPCVADLIAVQHEVDPGHALRVRCRSPGARAGARIDRAIARMAPEVSGPVGGACPACGGAIEAVFDIAAFVVAELRRLASGVHAEVHLLAQAYGWEEAVILGLPAVRRRRYADLVREERRSRLDLGSDLLAVA